MNEVTLIELFRDAARSHRSIEWFDAGPLEFLFNNQRNLEFPALFVQHLRSVGGDVRTSQFFTVYSLVSNPRDEEIDNNNFEWNDVDANARQTARQILDDVLGEVRLNHQQEFM